MIDPVALSIDAVLRGDTARLPLVALAGAMTSLGPCVAPRYVAIAALLGERRRTITVATFVAGMLTAYAALGFGTGLLGLFTGRASTVNLILALALAVTGAATLWRSGTQEHQHGHEVVCAGARSHRLSGVFSLGAGSAFVVSPCCTPVVAAVVGMTAVDANPLSRAALLTAFALGHAAPLFAVGSAGTLCARGLRGWHASPAAAIVSGALMLALGAYYGLLV